MRVELVVRGHVGEKHNGNPKPQKRLGFPQRLRRKTKRENVADEETKQREREREKEREREGETTNNISDMGQVLKGTNPNNIPSPETNTAQKNPKYIPKVPDKDPNAPTNKVSEESSPQGGGAHGPAALYFWGDAPGDRGTEGSKDPPATGTAPGGAITRHIP